MKNDHSYHPTQSTLATLSSNEMSPLLTDNEPAPYVLENTTGDAPIFISCDHASNLVPKSLNNLGLKASDLEKHIAYDIGALAISKILSTTFNAPLLYSNYSRLVTDLNRQLDDPALMPEVSDGIVIPANRALSKQQVEQRIDTLFTPYHNQFSDALDRFEAASVSPVIIGVHTFTPCWQGQQRPWHIGVMWDTDSRMANPFLNYLNTLEDICVGDNRPYHAIDPRGIDPVGYAFGNHARARGLPHLFIEVRQDLVANEAGAAHWANIIYQGVQSIISDASVLSPLK